MSCCRGASLLYDLMTRGYTKEAAKLQEILWPEKELLKLANTIISDNEVRNNIVHILEILHNDDKFRGKPWHLVEPAFKKTFGGGIYGVSKMWNYVLSKAR